MKRQFIPLLVGLLISLGCNKEEKPQIKNDSYVLLGNQFFAGGITYKERTRVLYIGSTTNGDIVKVDVQTGSNSLFAPGLAQNRTFCTGMQLDSKDRLWVCGGQEGKIQLLDAVGKLIKSWDMRGLYGAGFINDCVTDDDYVYFTDSQIPKIYRASVKNAEHGKIEQWLTFTNRQIPYSKGTNANGIVATPGNRYLIIVNSNSGKLFRIDKKTKEIFEIQLNIPVTSGDGLWLDGRILYVLQNATGQIFPVKLNTDFTEGIVGAGFGSSLEAPSLIPVFIRLGMGAIRRPPPPPPPG